MSFLQADFSEAEDVTEKKIVRHIFKVKPSKHLKGRYGAVCSSFFKTRNGKGSLQIKTRKKPGEVCRGFPSLMKYVHMLKIALKIKVLTKTMCFAAQWAQCPVPSLVLKYIR